MLPSAKFRVAALLLVMVAGAYWLWAADEKAKEPASSRDALMKLYSDGNYKDAYDGLRKLALDPKDDPAKVSADLTTALNCLHNLGRINEVDEFREGVIKAHKDNWRLLQTAAETYTNGHHYGFIVAGKFERGDHRGGGRHVDSRMRDRQRALQLMQQAMPLADKDVKKADVARFYLEFAQLFQRGTGHHDAWRLQYLTDLATLPDFNEGYWHGSQGAPVDSEGSPVYHHVPKSFADSQSDGERWRWLLVQAAETDPSLINHVDRTFADFLLSQFGVQTMAGFYRNPDQDNKSGTYALHTLKDTETIARLATGIKRFTLPDEFNHIKVYERIIARGNGPEAAHSSDTIASIYENRRQYVKAADSWKKAIAAHGKNNHRENRLQQIVGNWGVFEPLQTQPAGSKATVDFRFRNGTKVSFEAHAIKVEQLLEDVKEYIKSSPERLQYEKIDIHNIGYRLVERQENKYLGDKVAAWDEKLTPRPEHVDDRITVTTPMIKPGAYLLYGKMADGNTSRIVVWLSDTVIVKKNLSGTGYHFVADAVTGQPLPKADLHFFGWRQEQIGQTNKFRTVTTEFKDVTDKDGQLTLGGDKQQPNFQWLILAKQGDHFAYHGFTGVWYDRQYDPEYEQTKVLLITDRPVYRPKNTVQFKFWVRHAKYDEADVSTFANRDFTVRIDNPKGEKLLEKSFKSDAYGGIEGEFALSPGAMLGMYSIYIQHHGGGQFRVEEYKKPEFEVTVDAPAEPIRLGEKISATIKANYYFGAPVTSAKVKYKVMRTDHSSNWYPRGDWDWFYGPGYWWFAADARWYPGFSEWCGCMRPFPFWWHRGHVPPEIVLENEGPIGPDGTVKFDIDTMLAKELHGDTDHQYTITAEVVDESRRTIVGTGNILVSRKPFQVFTWLERGHYRAGDTIKAYFDAHTVDSKPVEGKGELSLFRISYDDKNEPVEKLVESWKLDTNVEGRANQQMKAAQAGQYRLSFKLTDVKKHTIEGGYLFTVKGQGFDGKDYRFNDIELITDKREYAPGDKVKLLINTNRENGTVLLFTRPTNGVYLAPKVLRLQGKSIEEEVAVIQRDMPNFFVEAVTVSNAQVHAEVREVVVPPEKRIINVEVLPNQQEYLPGQKATIKVKLTDLNGQPFVGSTVLSVYDKSVEYISGGSNVPEIKEYFWKWRRHHQPRTESSLARSFGNILRQGETGMHHLGIFGASVVEELAKNGWQQKGEGRGGGRHPAAPGGAAPEADFAADGREEKLAAKEAPAEDPGNAPAQPPGAEPAVRKNFADTAFWTAALTSNAKGEAEVVFNMPEQLTGWKVKVWAMGHGTKVGQGETVVTTKKNLLVRLQAPRFFVQKDEVVLSANVHNYLKTDKNVKVSLELDSSVLTSLDKPVVSVRIPAGGEKRVDWRVRVNNEGEAVIRMKAVSDEESDAMEMRFPALVHGMLKMDSFSGVVRPDKDSASVTMTVPAERRINASRLEVRYSPTLAGAMVDALPYLVEYPYGCTEQTLNRFLPTVITQNVLQKMNLDLKEIEKKRTNLNAQEIGDGPDRAKGWKRYERNAVFNIDDVKAMSQAGVDRLAGMQCSDGGWGWFSGFGEQSYPHTTAVVVHGLQLARDNNVTVPPQILERGVQWLRDYQNDQISRIKNFPTKTLPYKEHADNIDAFVYMVLVDQGHKVDDMRDFLYRDRTQLAVYAKAMLGLSLHKQQKADMLAMIVKNIEQYVVEDDENQTAYLKLPESNYWWAWYGSENEANAYYLKLLARTDPKNQKASRLVKYLLNNRKHATYWNSTRDTAICIEAMADYLAASGEDKPDMTIEVWLDGKKQKDVAVDAKNLFTFDNTFVLLGDAVEAGKHTLELKRKGKGSIYFNAYLTNFTLEDHITRAGLEVKVSRKYYKLTKVDKKIKVSGSRGQALDRKIEKYERTELANLAELKSGDLVEVELEIDSKNDYEYLCFEDPKASGFEPMLVRSGYNPNDMGAYMELRDDKVCFFVRTLARGKHSLSYRLRAEIPGKFSALPARAYAMYAPELKGNSDEIKLVIKD